MSSVVLGFLMLCLKLFIVTKRGEHDTFSRSKHIVLWECMRQKEPGAYTVSLDFTAKWGSPAWQATSAFCRWGEPSTLYRVLPVCKELDVGHSVNDQETRGLLLIPLLA